MVLGADSHTPSDIRHIPATVLAGQEQIKIIVPTNGGPEGVGVIIPGKAPVGIDSFVKVSFAIPVRVRQSRQLTLLRDINPVIDDFESHRFVQSACESAIRSSLHRSLRVLDDIHFPRPGADRQVAVVVVFRARAGVEDHVHRFAGVLRQVEREVVPPAIARVVVWIDG